MTEREQQILELIRRNALVSQDTIAAKLRISRSSVAGHIMRLVAKGAIKGRGYVLNDAPFAVVVGGANMDICGAPHGKTRLADSNPGSVTASPGGVARNVAENLARLDVDCRLLSAIGADQHGEALLHAGQAADVDMRHILQLEGHATSTYVSILDESGDLLIGINDMSITDYIRPAYLQSHESMLRQASIIIVDTNIPDASLAYLSEAFATQPLFIDAVSVAKAIRAKPYLNAIHTLKATRMEANALAGKNTTTKKQLPGLAKWFHEQGVQRVFITLGAQGVFCSTKDKHELVTVDGATESIANASGAGDAFVAGLAYAWLHDMPPDDTVRFAMSAASIALDHPATNNPKMSATAVRQHRERIFAKRI